MIAIGVIYFIFMLATALVWIPLGALFGHIWIGFAIFTVVFWFIVARMQ